MLAVVTPSAYLAAVVIAVVVGAISCAVPRRAPGPWVAWLSGAIGLALLTDAITWVTAQVEAGTFRATTSLPLALCNAVLVLAAIASFWPRPLLVELVWFLGLAGTLQGILTPDLSVGFPHLVFFQYVVGHCGIVDLALLLVVGRGIHPRRGAVIRTFLIAACYTAIVGVVDATTGADYMFLRQPPSNWTLLRLLGPWPYYVLSAAAVALVLFVVLDAPFWRERRRSQISLPEHRLRAFVVWGLLLPFGAAVFALTALLRDEQARWNLARSSGRLLCRVAGVRVRLVGEEPVDGRYVVVANHESFVDAMALILAFKRPLHFAAGSALEHQRIAGPYLRRLGCSFVGGGTLRDARQVLDQLAEQVVRGQCFAFFPEGSLSDTLGVRRFRLGAFLVASAAGASILPVAISNSREIVPPGRRLPTPGQVTVSFGAPLDSSEVSSTRLAETAREVVIALLDETAGAPPSKEAHSDVLAEVSPRSAGVGG